MLVNRRQWLRQSACGFGYLAFAGIAAQAAGDNPLAPKPPHHPPRAKRVIFLFMHGGPSHVDTFDYKPKLQQDDGKEAPYDAKTFRAHLGRKLLASPWKFRQHGESGLWISELFPEVAKHADELCVIRSLHTEGISHGQAVLMLHTGNSSLTRPSMGSWIVYGLGTENSNLPGFVTICPTRGHGGAQNYGSAFLPAVYQGTAIGNADTPASAAQIRFLHHPYLPTEVQRRQLDYVQRLNEQHLRRTGDRDEVEGVIQSYELAFRMQRIAPEILDLSRESAATRKLYGIDEKPTDDFGRQCLMARRLVEAGVRFVQVSHSFKWDQHGNLKAGHERNALEVDKPVAALLTDLRDRGLLNDTLVLWGGEFGRTPMVEGKDGRDHNPQGFTMWLAGGGVKPGFAYGNTDDYGRFAVENPVHMHDLHATILWLLGLDHEKLTFRYSGRDFRLTDVHGRVVREVMR
ncbi:MAG: DUF1501 domain-containing protein [Gemmatales bacterium]|nr:DUF1501 domain-containing protein [Gemmatales bacterium]MCS7161207.1 DUF1501 domain-containing protein [Gemmatales bacterium]MDW8176410.1 DUF1501 domain-containing protein [Gemmatales bacterium]MDW8221455.1 DUF1501 domain-containing protein [Gemmatales bacterium]